MPREPVHTILTKDIYSEENKMAFWLDLLFGNFIGLISMFTLIFILAMAGWFTVFFLRKIKEEDQANN
jgi:hypothetical protein